MEMNSPLGGKYGEIWAKAYQVVGIGRTILKPGLGSSMWANRSGVSIDLMWEEIV